MNKQGMMWGLGWAEGLTAEARAAGGKWRRGYRQVRTKIPESLWVMVGGDSKFTQVQEEAR